jgi:hypothetical protein
LILIRTEGMAVAVSSLAAYPNGFEFSVHAVLHHEQFTWGKAPSTRPPTQSPSSTPNKPSG